MAWWLLGVPSGVLCRKRNSPEIVMHIHSGGQPRDWTGASGIYTRKPPVSASPLDIDTADVETITQNPFTDVLKSAISSSVAKGNSCDATLHEQLNLIELEPVSRQYISSGMQKTKRQSPYDQADNPQTTTATPASSVVSTRGNLVNILA